MPREIEIPCPKTHSGPIGFFSDNDTILPHDSSRCIACATSLIHMPGLLSDVFGVSRSEARRCIALGALQVNAHQRMELDIPQAELFDATISLGKLRHYIYPKETTMQDTINQHAQDQAIQNVIKLRDQMIDAQQKAAEQIKTALAAGLKPVFDRYEFLADVRFTQHTPSFNDGDPCIFSSGFDYPALNTHLDVSEGTYSQSDEMGEDFYAHQYGDESEADPRYQTAHDEVYAIMKAFDAPGDTMSEIFKHAFGDYAEVIISAEGIRVEEFEGYY